MCDALAWQTEFKDVLDGRVVTLSKGQTHYHTYGTEGPWIVMVHGFSMNAALFEPLAKRLVSRFRCRVLAYDLYGRGYSATPSGPMNGEFFVQQLWELVDRIIGPSERITLLGFSMGSIVCVLSANPRVEGIVLLAPSGMSPTNLKLSIRLKMSPILGTMLLWCVGQRWALQDIASGNPTRQFHNRTGKEIVMDTFSRLLVRTWRKPDFVWTAQNTMRNLAEIHGEGLKSACETLGSKYACPVDVVLAEFDRASPPNAANWQGAIPRAKIWTIPTGHLSLMEDFPRVSDLVITILRSRPTFEQPPERC